MVVEHLSEEHKAVNRPRYSFAEADRIARVTPGTSSRWLKGYRYWYSPDEQRMSPPVTPGHGSQQAVSFVDLMEVATIGKLRNKGFSLKRIRQINAYCRVYLQDPRPLVTEKFRVAGQDIFINDEDFGVLVNVGREAGMRAWEEVLEPFLDDVEYEEELVRRWWPLGKNVGVVVDPDYGFGLPVIAGTGIRTEIIAERTRAGDSTEEITYDFGVTPSQIEDALRWEEMPSAA
jgi:uncharacterized protein (DUF433 family)